MIFRVEICVKLKKDVLDPQGKAIQKAAMSMGLKNIFEINQGKYFDIIIRNSSSKKNAEDTAEKLAKKLLVNEIIEDYIIVAIKKI